MIEYRDPRIDDLLYKLLIGVVSGGVACFVTFCRIMWVVIKTQRSLKSEVEDLNRVINTDISKLKTDVAKLEANVLTLETLKRIELFMMALSKSERENALIKAIRAEIEIRESKHD